MRKQNYLNLILMLLLLAKKLSAQVGNGQSYQITIPSSVDSTYQKVAVMNYSPIFFPFVKEKVVSPFNDTSERISSAEARKNK